MKCDKFIYNCVIIFGILFSGFQLHADGSEIHYVRNYQEFREHTAIHIENVVMLGMTLYKKYKLTYFNDVPKEVLFQKLLSHDYEKLAPINELREMGYKDQKDLGRRLYSFYHKNEDELTEKNQRDFNILRNNLNSYASIYDADFFARAGMLKKNGFPNKTARLIMSIEKIADLVDRELNEISPEEFHVEKMKDAEIFLEGQTSKKMAEYLRSIYYQRIPKNHLVLLFEKRELTPSICAGLFN